MEIEILAAIFTVRLILPKAGVDEFIWPWEKGAVRKKKWFVTHIKGKRVEIGIIAAIFQWISKQSVNLPTFL